MATKTVRVWGTETEIGASQDSQDCYLYTKLSSINTRIQASDIPANATITSAKLYVNAGYSGGYAPQVYLTLWIGNTTANNVSIMSRTKISSGSFYPSGGYELIDYFADKVQPAALDLASYGSYLVARMDTANWGTPTMKINYAEIRFTYTEHSHSYTSEVTTPATCTSAGVRTYTCSCDHSYTESIPALGHSYGTPTYTWSADGKTCTANRVCGRNSSHTETATATITSAVKTAATCTAKGTTRYTAKFSVSWATTQTKDVQDIAAKGHSWVAATCTAPKTCSVCGATEGSALGHSYTSTVVAPTATSHGYTRHTCTRCGHYYDDTITYLVTIYCGEGGTFTGLNVGDNVVADGQTVTLTATPDEGYKFYSFRVLPNDDDTFPSIVGDHTDNPFTFTVVERLYFYVFFEKLAPEITSVQMLYQNKQISAKNKVPAGEFFRIVVGAQ